jgi:hypothetical protein
MWWLNTVTADPAGVFRRQRASMNGVTRNPGGFGETISRLALVPPSHVDLRWWPATASIVPGVAGAARLKAT